jgi:hypothetical protein
MKLRKLYIFVEGNDDERFFGRIIKPMFKKQYADIEIIKYAQWKKEKVNLFLLSIKTLKFDYIFTADLDYQPTVSQKKKSVLSIFTNLDKEKISVVVMEIESWYLAGLTDEATKQFDMPLLDDTDNVSKEDFNRIYHRRFKSRIHCMHELLKAYSISSARLKNQSFKYFADKYFSSRQ